MNVPICIGNVLLIELIARIDFLNSRPVKRELIRESRIRFVRILCERAIDGNAQRKDVCDMFQ